LKSAISEKYIAVLNQLNRKFDIIITDGIHREECCFICFKLFDGKRGNYFKRFRVRIKHLIKEDFKSIDYWGMPPGLLYKKSTTVFYKTQNCLGI